MFPKTEMPFGRLRVSEAVVNKLVVAAAHEVHGVVDVHGLVVGALLGGVAGGALGLLQGGPVGVAVGASAGSAVGAATSHLIDRRQQFYGEADEIPEVHMRLTAQYGADLSEVAQQVREEVTQALYTTTGLKVAQVHVEFVEVIRPRRRPSGPADAPVVPAPAAEEEEGHV